MAAALVNKAITVGQLDRSDKGVRVYDQVGSRWALRDPDAHAADVD